MDLRKTLYISASGMEAQRTRLNIVAQNIANADSTGRTSQEDPYRRKTIAFRNEFDKAMGVEQVKVAKIATDTSEFDKRYEPGHPAADTEGYVRYPNVNTVIEMQDMREALRSYEANISAIETSKAMLTRTIDLLR